MIKVYDSIIDPNDKRTALYAQDYTFRERCALRLKVLKGLIKIIRFCTAGIYVDYNKVLF